MEWHPFYYKGLKTNIEFNKLGQVKRLPKEWMIKKRVEKLVNIKSNNRGYQTLCFMTEDRNLHYILLHQALAIVFLNHNPNNYQLVIDHIDNNKLNNKIENLQIISQRENVIKYTNDKRDLPTGVFYYNYKDKIKYRSYIYYNKKQIYLGFFDNIEQASEKYNKALEAIKNNKFVSPMLPHGGCRLF
jgi:hypothetical protein